LYNIKSKNSIKNKWNRLSSLLVESGCVSNNKNWYKFSQEQNNRSWFNPPLEELTEKPFPPPYNPNQPDFINNQEELENMWSKYYNLDIASEKFKNFLLKWQIEHKNQSIVKTEKDFDYDEVSDSAREMLENDSGEQIDTYFHNGDRIKDYIFDKEEFQAIMPEITNVINSYEGLNYTNFEDVNFQPEYIYEIISVLQQESYMRNYNINESDLINDKEELVMLKNNYLEKVYSLLSNLKVHLPSYVLPATSFDFIESPEAQNEAFAEIVKLLGKILRFDTKALSSYEEAAILAKKRLDSVSQLNGWHRKINERKGLGEDLDAVLEKYNEAEKILQNMNDDAIDSNDLEFLYDLIDGNKTLDNNNWDNALERLDEDDLIKEIWESDSNYLIESEYENWGERYNEEYIELQQELFPNEKSWRKIVIPVESIFGFSFAKIENFYSSWKNRVEFDDEISEFLSNYISEIKENVFDGLSARPNGPHIEKTLVEMGYTGDQLPNFLDSIAKDSIDKQKKEKKVNEENEEDESLGQLSEEMKQNISNIIKGYVSYNGGIDKDEKIASLVRMGVPVDKRTRGNWLRTNIDLFTKQYYNQRTTNEEENNNGEKYPEPEELYNAFGKFMTTWVSSRVFGSQSESIHDALYLFFSKDIIEQKGLTSFLEVQLNTPRSELEVLLNSRGGAISKGMIIPGISKTEKLEQYLLQHTELLIPIENIENHYITQNEKGLFDIVQKDINKIVRSDIKDQQTAAIIIRILESEFYTDNQKGITKYRVDHKFPNATPEQYPFAEALDRYGYDEKVINKFFKKLRISEKPLIPSGEWKIGGFTFKILEKEDPLGVILGNITSCCQVIDGFAEDAVYDGYKNPRSGFLAIFDSRNRVVAQSWIRLGISNTLYLDNIEAIGLYDENVPENKKNFTKLRASYLDFAKKLKEERQYENVVCGGGHSDITFPGTKEIKKYKKKNEFGKTHDLYTDIGEHVYVMAIRNKKNWYKTSQKKKVLYIMRGLPGSGKSHFAEQLGKDGIVLSTDDFWYEIGNGKYAFDRDRHGEAHLWNQKRAKEAIEKGISPIVIDNTNVSAYESKPYVETGLENGYSVEIKEPDTPWKFDVKELTKRNSHDVPEEVIQDMLYRYQENPDLTIDEILQSKSPSAVENTTSAVENTRWYKTADNSDLLYDIMDQIREDFESNPKGKQPWSRLNANDVKRIWNQYSKTGEVKVTTINIMAELVVNNLRKIIANSYLLDDNDFIKNDEDLENWNEYISDEYGNGRYSRDGLVAFAEALSMLENASTSEDLLLSIDYTLNIVHGIGSAAYWFIDGGVDTLDDLQAKSNKNWYKTSISNENAWLRNYLRSGFDPYAYTYEIFEFLKEKDLVFDDDEREHYEIADEWLSKADENEINEFKKWFENSRFYGESSISGPPHSAMEFVNYVKPTWLVHFTDDASSISFNGFKYGHEDMDIGLALTTHKRNREKNPGYNFAFEEGSRDAKNVASDGKYGNEAVVFWGDGVKAYHSGDEENQIIFWGPSVDTRMIFPIRIVDGDSDWAVYHSDRGTPMVQGDFPEITAWVIDNYGMLQNLHGKNKKGKK